MRSGRAASVSAWVNLALEEHAAKERPLRAMADAVAAYEKEQGSISVEEIEKQRRLDRRNVILVEPASPKRTRKKSRSAA